MAREPFGPDDLVNGMANALAQWQGARTHDEAAQELGVSKSTYQRWLKGSTTPNVRELATVCDRLGLNPNSLFGIASASQSTPKKVNSGTIVDIPILDVSAGAGAAVDNHDDAEIVAHMPFPLRFLRKLHIKPENVRAVRARGDSMEPTIANGMLVLIDVSFQELQDGRVYALRGLDGLRLKRVQRQLDGSVAIMSDNRDKYLPERLSREEAQAVEVAGRAFWTEKLL